jgi:ABC-type tungstate transport system permease subunit
MHDVPRMLRQVVLLVCLISLAGSSPGAGQQASITVASTTSTEQSGLFGYILPRFTSKTGIGVRVVALGTGQALDVGRRGDADVVFVHDQAAEEEFVAQGFGVKRYAVMYNDFVLIGPQADPAKIAGGKDILEALRKIGAAKVPFISRGDRSGTHAAELRYWNEAGGDLAVVKGPWYREITICATRFKISRLDTDPLALLSSRGRVGTSRPTSLASDAVFRRRHQPRRLALAKSGPGQLCTDDRARRVMRGPGG